MVDDASGTAHGLSAKLDDGGYRVVGVATTSEAALDLAPDADLALVDVRLGGDSEGVKVADVIRDRYRIPVVFLAASSDEAALERAWTAEPYGYLIRPINHRELRSIIEIALHRHEIDRKRERLMDQLKGALANVDVLTGRITICAWCKNVKDDEGRWAGIDEYLGRRLQATYTHSICPSCIEKHKKEDPQDT